MLDLSVEALKILLHLQENLHGGRLKFESL